MIIEYTIHILSSAIQTYIVYLYLKSFFKEKNSIGSIKKMSYFLFCVIRVTIKLCLRVPLIIALYSFFGILLLSFNYKTSLKRRMFYVSFIYLIFTITNGAAALMVPAYNPSILTFQIEYSLYASILSKLMNLFIICVFMLFKRFKDRIGLTVIIGGALIYIPFSTLFVLILIYEANNISVILKLISILLALGLNFIIFYLYSILPSLFEKEWQDRVIKQQNIYYENELNLMQKNLKSIRSLKHDLQNHLSVIFGLVKQNRNEECMVYLEEINSMLSTDKVIAKSGNVVIDSIINFKLYELERNQTSIIVNLKIPNEMNIPSFDIATIVGNLVDNAIEGAMTVSENRFISISIIQNKGMLSFKIQNSFDGIIKKDKEKILSRKRGFTTIGAGIERVLTVINTYDGLLEYEIDDKIFSVKALIYVA